MNLSNTSAFWFKIIFVTRVLAKDFQFVIPKKEPSSEKKILLESRW
jgi:hypothetical protein